MYMEWPALNISPFFLRQIATKVWPQSPGCCSTVRFAVDSVNDKERLSNLGN